MKARQSSLGAKILSDEKSSRRILREIFEKNSSEYVVKIIDKNGRRLVMRELK